MSAPENFTVLIVGPGGDRAKGGIGRMIGNLSAYWSARSESPNLVVLDARGLGRLIWSPILLLRTMLQIAYWRLMGNAALIHINMADRGSIVRKYVVMRTAKLVGLPVVLHLHTGNFVEHVGELPNWATSRIGWMFRSADHVIVLATVFRDFISSRFDVAQDKISVVYNGSPDILVSAAPAETTSTIQLSFFGRIEDPKGLPELFEALCSPALKQLDWSFTFAGLGDIEKYQSIAQSNGILDRVSFPGWLEQQAAMELLARSDVMVLPSRYEGFPMTVLEALSVGTAVVVTKVGAIPEVLTHNQNALLCDIQDVESLTENLKRVISDSELRAHLINNGRQHFDEMFSIATQAKNIEAIYRSVSPGAQHDLSKHQTAEVNSR